MIMEVGIGNPNLIKSWGKCGSTDQELEIHYNPLFIKSLHNIFDFS